MTVLEYRRTTDAPDSAAAQAEVTAMARADGLVVRTVKSVRLERCIPAGLSGYHPRYTVTLAVTERPDPLEVACD